MTAKLADKQDLNSRFTLYRFELVSPYQLHNQAGQYIMLQIDKDTMRAYSMCDRPDVDSSFELLLDRTPAGVGVRYLEKLNFGDEITFLAPLGQLVVAPDEPAEHLYLLATGSGVSPFKAIITDQLQLQRTAKNITLIWSLTNDQDFFWLEDFLDLQDKYNNFTFIPTVDQPSPAWTLRTGYITDVLRTLTLPTDAHFYLCGHPLMIAAATTYLQEQGFDQSHLTAEQFLPPSAVTKQ